MFLLFFVGVLGGVWFGVVVGCIVCGWWVGFLGVGVLRVVRGEVLFGGWVGVFVLVWGVVRVVGG
ncbi:hypothetical protein RA265_28825, partial [Pseudomonas syringae pv. tagetis]|uniref:hypothetical protein n=1 Tax=Pseudomonas syringae group genomosp. 7 TaxID=251699 RepID=UPI00376F4672